MIDGRHCTKRDLDLLVCQTNNIISFLAKDSKNEEKTAELQHFLMFLRRFDNQIADSLQSQIGSLNEDYDKIKNAIEKHVDELKQNVIIDIYEHRNG